MRMDKNCFNEPKIADYYSLQPFTFHYVKQLEIHQTSPEEDYVAFLEMELHHADPADKRSLFLTFDSVLDLRLVQPVRMPLYMCQLEIQSIRDRQWEGAYYSVKEVEDDIISFLCRSFTARVNQNND